MGGSKEKVIATLRYNFPPFCTVHNWFSIVSIYYPPPSLFLFLGLRINLEIRMIEEITKRDTISWKFWEWRLARLPVLPPFHLDFHFPRDIYITDNVIHRKKIAYRLVLSTPARSGTHEQLPIRLSFRAISVSRLKKIVIFLAIEALVEKRKIIVSFEEIFLKKWNWST